MRSRLRWITRQEADEWAVPYCAGRAVVFSTQLIAIDRRAKRRYKRVFKANVNPAFYGRGIAALNKFETIHFAAQDRVYEGLIAWQERVINEFCGAAELLSRDRAREEVMRAMQVIAAATAITAEMRAKISEEIQKRVFPEITQVWIDEARLIAP